MVFSDDFLHFLKIKIFFLNSPKLSCGLKTYKNNYLPISWPKALFSESLGISKYTMTFHSFHFIYFHNNSKQIYKVSLVDKPSCMTSTTEGIFFGGGGGRKGGGGEGRGLILFSPVMRFDQGHVKPIIGGPWPSATGVWRAKSPILSLEIPVMRKWGSADFLAGKSNLWWLRFYFWNDFQPATSRAHNIS